MNPQPATPPIDALFVSELPLWPADQGFRIHGPQMARALAASGLNVRMASLRETAGDLPAWLRDMLVPWPTASDEDAAAFLRGWRGPFARLRASVASHQALDPRELAGLVPLTRELQPKVIIALGQHGPILLRGIDGPQRAWYAADEPVTFQLSCLRREAFSALRRRARLVGVYGLIHALFAQRLDLVVGVSDSDTRWLGRFTRARKHVTIPNGVDLDRLKPGALRGFAPPSLVFWGRMDFEPNVDAVRWFIDRIWPALRERHPTARFDVVGKNPTPEVRAMAEIPGVRVIGDVPSIEPWARSASAVVLPMRCGRGIKNKLLEAAAMGLPIVASPRAVAGLRLPEPAPVSVCRSRREWVSAVSRMWSDPDEAARFGRRARQWVERDHTWAAAADRLAHALSLAQPKLGVVRNEETQTQRKAA